jgi:hypothetical protein
MDFSDRIGFWSDGLLANMPYCRQYWIAWSKLSIVLPFVAVAVGFWHSILATKYQYLVVQVFGVHAAWGCSGHCDVRATH